MFTHQHTHTLMHLHKQITQVVIITISTNTKKNKQNNRLEKIHPNNTSKPAFLCKNGGGKNLKEHKWLSWRYCRNWVCAGVINVHLVFNHGSGF